MDSQTQNDIIKAQIVAKKLNSSFSQKNLLKNFSNKNATNKKQRSLSSIDNKKETIKIIWSEGGKKIYLSGSFCHWEKLYLMTKDDREEFYYIIIDLPKGFHQFKFKVDGKWKISSIYQQCNINGNVYNYIDNTNTNYNFDNTSVSTVESSVLSTNDNQKKLNYLVSVNNCLKIDFSYSKKNYCNYYPKKKEMREYIEKKPYYFQTECYHGVNQTQNEIGNKKYLYLVENSIFSGNDSYKVIERKDHVLLNHLCSKKIKNNTISSVPVKFRHKNVTFLYYK